MSSLSCPTKRRLVLTLGCHGDDEVRLGMGSERAGECNWTSAGGAWQYCRINAATDVWLDEAVVQPEGVVVAVVDWANGRLCWKGGAGCNKVAMARGIAEIEHVM